MWEAWKGRVINAALRGIGKKRLVVEVRIGGHRR